MPIEEVAKLLFAAGSLLVGILVLVIKMIQLKK